MEHIFIKKLFVVSLKFKYNSASSIISGSPNSSGEGAVIWEKEVSGESSSPF